MACAAWACVASASSSSGGWATEAAKMATHSASSTNRCDHRQRSGTCVATAIAATPDPAASGARCAFVRITNAGDGLVSFTNAQGGQRIRCIFDGGEGFWTEHGMPTFAAIDIGSNSCRLAIAATQAHHLKILHEDREVVRLGESVFETGVMSP